MKYIDDISFENIDLIFTDLDGCPAIDSQISILNQIAMTKFLEDKTKDIVVASGRPIGSIEHVLKKTDAKYFIDKNLHVAGYNGAIAKFRGQIINNQPMDFGYVLNLLDRAFLTDTPAIIYTNNGIAASWDTEWTNWFFDVTGSYDAGIVKTRSELLTSIDTEVYMMEFQKSRCDRETFAKELGIGNELKRYFFKPPFKGCPRGIEVMQVIPQEIDKAVALKLYVQKLQISRHNVVVIGDGLNDITMLSISGIIPVTFEDAHPKVKSIPEIYMAPPAFKDGFYHVLKQIMSNK